MLYRSKTGRVLCVVGRKRLKSFSTKDFLIVDHAFRGHQVPADLKERLPFLIEEGVIEKIGRDKYTLSRQFFQFLGKKAVYARHRGLDRETNKVLLLKHIQDNRTEGSKWPEGRTGAGVKRTLGRREVRPRGRLHPRGWAGAAGGTLARIHGA
jgi:hypothetical protein